MKISQLIEKLESLKQNHGDNEISFSVHDEFTKYGYPAVTYLKAGETTGLPTDWNDVSTNKDSGISTIHFHIQKSDSKRAKITFR